MSLHNTRWRWFILSALLCAPCVNGATLVNAPYQVCFTPQGRCTSRIIRVIDNAHRSLAVQAYSFTSRPIAKALVNAKQRGVAVTVILDKSNVTDRYSQVQTLLDAHIPVFIDAKVRIAHNKVIVADDMTVVTGSFNFSWSAEHRNAENVLIITDATLAKRYLSNIRSRLRVSTAVAHFCNIKKVNCRLTLKKGRFHVQ